jgi:hypothetical protein
MQFPILLHRQKILQLYQIIEKDKKYCYLSIEAPTSIAYFCYNITR